MGKLCDKSLGLMDVITRLVRGMDGACSVERRRYMQSSIKKRLIYIAKQMGRASLIIDGVALSRDDR